MTSFVKMFDNLKLSVYNRFSENPAKLLIFAGTLGWTLSCLAQVCAIQLNDKLSQKDKRFLVPQEIADGAVNVGLFLGATMGMQKATEKAIETGKIMFAETKKPLEEILSKNKLTLADALKNNENKISNILKDSASLEQFTKLKGGASLATALIGSIISCNILTPIIRNFIGAKWQKKLTEQNVIKSKVPATTIQKPQISDKQIFQPVGKINTPVYNNFYPSSNLKI